MRRRNTLRDRYFKFAQQAGLAPRKELPHLIRENNKKPGDVFLPAAKGGAPACLDFAVTTTVQFRLLNHTAKDPTYAGARYEEEKRKKHAEECNREGYTFIPVVVDNWGIWGEEADTAFAIAAMGLAGRNNTHPDVERRTIQDDLNTALTPG